MAPGPEDHAPPGFSIKLLWCALVLAAAGLFALLPDDGEPLAQPPLALTGEVEARSRPAVEAAVAPPGSEIDALRQKVRHLEAEVAALQHCGPAPTR